MRPRNFLAWLFLSIWLSACASFQAAGDIAHGRQALIEGNNQTALGYFQAAEQVDPAYVYGTELRQGVLSYLGRAQYLTGNYAQARSTLERALSQNPSDNIARLYLGLTLARQGETQKALPDIDGGMRGIYDLLNYITDTFRFGDGQYWDPGRDIRSAIEKESGDDRERENRLANAYCQWRVDRPQDGTRAGPGAAEPTNGTIPPL
jgi:tetratricopeptide (TPR) repeat protein